MEEDGKGVFIGVARRRLKQAIKRNEEGSNGGLGRYSGVITGGRKKMTGLTSGSHQSARVRER
jgi:hypothetical protein